MKATQACALFLLILLLCPLAAQAGTLAAAERTLAFAFDELVAPGNFDSWKVVVNGVPCTSVRVGATKDGLKLFDRGFLVLVR